MEYAINVENVTKRYEGFTLNKASFKLPKGSIMGLVGENGAGKTTLIKLILGLQKIEEGKIFLMGRAPDEVDAALKEQVGVVLDDCCFSENLNLMQINKIMLKVYKQWEEPTFYKYIEYFGLPVKKSIKDYSKGMKMKLSIAVALSHKAKLLILDEATSGLDPVIREEILDVFFEFIQDEENSILISSHITSDLEKICDYITFIIDGNIVLSDVKDDILENYGILKCSKTQFEEIDKNLVSGYKYNEFGISALVKRKECKGEYIIDKANLEDIFLYSVKGRQ